MTEISNKIGLPPIGKCGFIFYTRNKLFEYLVNELLSPYPIFVDNETYDSSRYDGILDDDFLNEFMFLQKYIYQGNAPSSMVAGDILRLVALLVILLGYIHQDNRATKSEINELNSLISPSPLNETVKVDIRILDNSIFDAKFIETWEKLMVSQNKYLSLGVLIRWEELWNHLERVFRSEDGASAKIFSSIKLQGEVFSFNHQKV